MKIAVCIKSVPKKIVAMDKETGNLQRENAGTQLNIYDYSALEAALKIKDKNNAHITVCTMGPMSAETVLRETLAIGCDRAILISDSAYRGADVLATSFTLAGAINYLDDFDLIICGKQTIDGDTAQVPAAIAAQLTYNYIPYVKNIEIKEKNTINLVSNMGDELYYFQTKFPLVISIDPKAYLPRTASLANKLKSRKQNIEILTQQELTLNSENIGIKGSPTRVVQVHKKEVEHKQEIKKKSSEELLEYIYKEVDTLRKHS